MAPGLAAAADGGPAEVLTMHGPPWMQRPDVKIHGCDDAVDLHVIIAPPYNVTADDLDRIVARLGDAVDATVAAIR